MNERLERVVIAGLIHAPDLNVKAIRGVLCASDFAWPHHAWLYSKCLDLWKELNRVPLPLDVIFHRIRSIRTAELSSKDFGERSERCLVAIIDSDPTGAWCKNAAMRVRSLAERRRIIHAARLRIRDAIDGVLRV